MSSISFKKEYLPGYTGHVPQKNSIFGCTAGDINKIIGGTSTKTSNFDVDMDQRGNYAQKTFYSRPPTQDCNSQKVIMGNQSKTGQNWIGGPTNNLKAQHIPGYQGYVPNIKSENIMGTSFARVTGKAINKEFVQGFSQPAYDRFTTTQAQDFNKDNFRRLQNDVQPAEKKDQVDSKNFTDAEFQGIEITKRNIYMEMPTVGYQGFKSAYRPVSTNIYHRKDPYFNINPMKPKLKDIEIDQTPEFASLTNGFKKAATSTSYRGKAGMPDNSQMTLPVVGYTGHRTGNKSQNFYGKPFRDCAIQSRIVHKMAQ